MHDESTLLRSLVLEYQAIPELAREHEEEDDRNQAIELALRQKHDWTAEGASTILALANDYGAFILRNALAVALALDKEDGDLDL